MFFIHMRELKSQTIDLVLNIIIVKTDSLNKYFTRTLQIFKHNREQKYSIILLLLTKVKCGTNLVYTVVLTN